jgi:hypothetical protein
VSSKVDTFRKPPIQYPSVALDQSGSMKKRGPGAPDREGFVLAAGRKTASR